jgi:aryl-alcohol dehydrogenase
MMQEIRAAVLRAPNAPFSIESARLDAPRADEVLVELVATGICHSDVAIVEQILPLPMPLVLGHEGAGIVREVGSAVTNVTVGDHVVLGFASCGACHECVGGHPAYCDLMGALNFGMRRQDGSVVIYDEKSQPLNASFFGQSSFATHSVVRAHNVVKVRKDIPLKLLGPLGCGFMTGAGTMLNVMKPERDSHVAIFGAGAVGFAALFAARLMGCRRIAVVDRVKSRLELARELGATDIINTAESNLDEALAAFGGLNRAMDTTGVPGVIESAVRALKIRGVLVLVGASHEHKFSTDIMHMISGRVIMGAVEGDSVPATFIPFLADKFMQGEFPIDRLSAFYPFDNINSAVADGTSGKTIKPILTF